jgi:SAM-dependent methyltransferase
MTTDRQPTAPASDHLTSSNWAGERGDKWLAQLDAMEAMLAPIDAPLIDALRLDAPCRVADVGCGGGRTTLEILRRAPAGSVVHGFDISQGLVDSARAHARSADPRAIGFTRADVATAALAGAPYERLTSRFGVMFFDDPAAAFRNLAGWLAPGARFAFAVWGRPVDNPWMTTVRDVVAELLEVPPSEPNTPGPFRYGDAGLLQTVLADAGFRGVVVDDWRGSLIVGGGLAAAEAAEFSLASLSIAERVLRAGDAVQSEARARLAARFADHLRNGSVWLGAGVHIVSGTRGT